MGAAWIDLWRLLVLWKFGGIYADLDSSPVPSRFNATTITPEDDAFFVLETL
jgi:mannosyltransferase OCH1-like enzyme